MLNYYFRISDAKHGSVAEDHLHNSNSPNGYATGNTDSSNILLLSSGAQKIPPPLKPYFPQSPPILNGDAKKSFASDSYYKPSSFGLYTNGGGPNGTLNHHNHNHQSEVVFQGVATAAIHPLPPKVSHSASRITFWEMLRSSKKCLISFILCIILIIVLSITVILAQNHREVCDTHACWDEVRRIEGSINRNVSACEDFYEFVCGKWMSNTVIPEHKPQETRFDQLQDKVKHEIKGA